MPKLPSFQFYPGDWMKDPALRSVSLAARGLYVDMLCIFWESPDRGISPYPAGKLEAKAWAKVVGHRADYVKKLVVELELAKVLSRRVTDRRLYSRRLVREELERKEARENYARRKAGSTLDQPPFNGHSSSSSSSSTSSSTSKKEIKSSIDDLKASYLAKCQDPSGMVGAMLDIIIDRAERSGIKVQSEAYLAKAVENFDTEAGQDREELLQKMRRLPA